MLQEDSRSLITSLNISSSWLVLSAAAGHWSNNHHRQSLACRYLFNVVIPFYSYPFFTVYFFISYARQIYHITLMEFL